jgi:hypothetical protein
MWGKDGPPITGHTYRVKGKDGKERGRTILRIDGGYVVYVNEGCQAPERICLAQTWRQWINWRGMK